MKRVNILIKGMDHILRREFRDGRPRGENLNDPNRKRKSCHRCANIRKDIVPCKSEVCNYVYCRKCKDKVIAELGEMVFEDGCPRCKGLCCCFNKSYSCTRIWHCYKKCPKTFGLRELPKKRKSLDIELSPPRSLLMPSSSLPSDKLICPVSDTSSSSSSVLSTATVVNDNSLTKATPMPTFLSPGSRVAYIFGDLGNKNMLATPSSEDFNQEMARMEEKRGVGQLLFVADALRDDVTKDGKEYSFTPVVTQSNISTSPRESPPHGGAVSAGYPCNSLMIAKGDSSFDDVLAYPSIPVSQNIMTDCPFQARDAHPSSMAGHSCAGVSGVHEGEGRTITADLSPIDITGITWTSDNDMQEIIDRKESHSQ